MDKLVKLQTFLVYILIGILIWISISILVSASEVTDSNVVTSNQQMNKHSFYWVVALVGGCIGTTLAYVSWKKYKAEINKKIKKDANS